jgi:CheY-like chemotaxis protein
VHNHTGKILVNEGHLDSGESLRLLLQLHGYDVKLARSGTQGVLLARDWRSDVVLSDLGLPGLNGFGVTTALRSSGSRPIAITAYDSEEVRRRALESGFEEVLIKPVPPGRLVGLLRRPRRQRVLLIEDHPESAKVLRLMLETLGQEVHVARDGAEGVALARVEAGSRAERHQTAPSGRPRGGPGVAAFRPPAGRPHGIRRRGRLLRGRLRAGVEQTAGADGFGGGAELCAVSVIHRRRKSAC